MFHGLSYGRSWTFTTTTAPTLPRLRYDTILIWFLILFPVLSNGSCISLHKGKVHGSKHRKDASPVHTICDLRPKFGARRPSAHLKSEFAGQVHTTLKSTPDRFCDLRPSQVRKSGRKAQHLRPTCALRFLRWNHTRRFCGAFYRQLSLDSNLFCK